MPHTVQVTTFVAELYDHESAVEGKLTANRAWRVPPVEFDLRKTYFEPLVHVDSCVKYSEWLKLVLPPPPLVAVTVRVLLSLENPVFQVGPLADTAIPLW